MTLLVLGTIHGLVLGVALAISSQCAQRPPAVRLLVYAVAGLVNGLLLGCIVYAASVTP